MDELWGLPLRTWYIFGYVALTCMTTHNGALWHAKSHNELPEGDRVPSVAFMLLYLPQMALLVMIALIDWQFALGLGVALFVLSRTFLRAPMTLIGAVLMSPFALLESRKPQHPQLYQGSLFTHYEEPSAREKVMDLSRALQLPATEVPPLLRMSSLRFEPDDIFEAMQEEYANPSTPAKARKAISDSIQTLGFFCEDEEIDEAESEREEGNEDPYDRLLMESAARWKYYKEEWEEFLASRELP